MSLDRLEPAMDTKITVFITCAVGTLIAEIKQAVGGKLPLVPMLMSSLQPRGFHSTQGIISVNTFALN